jgi:biotin synthase
MTTETNATVCDVLGELIERLGLDARLRHRTTLWAAARALTYRRSGGRARLWAAIGLDYVPCSMACKFCSFGEPWTTITHAAEMSLDEAERLAQHFLDAGANYLVLRTSECYASERLLELGRRLSRRLHPDVRLVANTSSLTCEGWRELRASGFHGIYRTIRLREGIDTPFDPADRLKSIQAAQTAGLEVFALVEPVGPEHTAAELATAIITLRDQVRPVLIGAMARVPVPGSPLGHLGRVDDTFLADLTAIIVLSMLPALTACNVVCSHPPSPWLPQAGVNALVIEAGAIPRDTAYTEEEWGGFRMEEAANLLRTAEYNL